MKAYASDQIRNVLLAGHQGTGMTTLGEALLFITGATSRVGTIEDGNTVLDFEEEEREKHISTSLAVAPVEWEDHKVNILDSPGFADFVGEVQLGMRVADTVCLVVSASEGVQVQHEIAWELADKAGLPRIVFVNKCDRPRADVQGTIEQLRDVFGPGVAPLQLPIGEEESFRGVVSLLDGVAYEYTDGTPRQVDIPDELTEVTAELRQQAVDAIVENDEELMERYFADDEIKPEELFEVLGRGVAVGETFPVVCGSATARVGLDRLLNLVVRATPSPLDRPGLSTADASGAETGTVDDPSGDPAAFVFKTSTDPFVGHIHYFRVARGRVKLDDHLINARSGKDERLHQVFAPRGSEHVQVGTFDYGDIGAVAKLSETETGDTLAAKGTKLRIAPATIDPPVYALAIRPKTQGDEDKLANALHRIVEEDAAIHVERLDETHETLLWGLGDTHVGIVLDRMRRKYGVEIATDTPKVAYRETATRPSEFLGKHKKQSGGHGQFGVAHIRLEPLGRSEGYEFVDKIVGGVIPRQYIPAVDKGIRDAMSRGPLSGFPVVDVRVSLDDGKYHAVDSDENSFRMAGRLALNGAMQDAGPILLEPIGHLEVLVPTEMAGDVSGDLNSRRGRLQGMDTIGGRQLIKAMVPMAEMHTYSIDLRSMTGGHGRFSIDFDHYDPVPRNLADKILADAKAED